jgi:hypothetical protein
VLDAVANQSLEKRHVELELRHQWIERVDILHRIPHDIA